MAPPDATGPASVQIGFFGVRGSYPCPGAAWARYGGNTACVVLTRVGEPPLLLDMGTGMVAFGAAQALDSPFRGTALVTHAHWDHIQGLPYFAPVNRPGATLDVYGPTEGGLSLNEVFDLAIAPPVFPVSWRDLSGDIVFHDVATGCFTVGGFTVWAGTVPHPGTMVGYRVEGDGAAIAYVSDHQMPAERGVVDVGVLSLCERVDLLVHDAQYTDEEFSNKPDWGHCTIDYAIEVARQASARQLAFFHHDPAHDDGMMDALAADAVEWARERGVDAFVAMEGTSFELRS